MFPSVFNNAPWHLFVFLQKKAVHRILSLLVVFPLLLSAQNQSINQVDEQGRKQGVWKKYYDSTATKLRYTGTFSNNEPVDTFFYYYRTGDLQSLMIHDERGYDYIINYHPAGIRMSEGRYWKQQKDSVWRYYNEDGQRINKEFYIEGKRYGTWTIYHDNGKPAEERNWENDIEQGPFKQYYRDGTLKREAHYEKGSIEGTSRFYHENGKVRMEGKYYHDAKQGVWIEYDEQGQKIGEVEYVRGVPKGGLQELPLGDTSKYYRKDQLDEYDFYPEEEYAPIEKKRKR